MNGLIAMDEEKDYSFISDIAWNAYLDALENAGVFIMGGRTYEVSLRTGAFPYKGCLNVVMTSKKPVNKWDDKVIFTDQKPKDVLRMLEVKGFGEVIVTGGHLSTNFLRDNLVDEIWVNLMPQLFTKGINVFSGEQFNVKLQLLGCQKSEDGEVLLKYKVNNVV